MRRGVPEPLHGEAARAAVGEALPAAALLDILCPHDPASRVPWKRSWTTVVLMNEMLSRDEEAPTLRSEQVATSSERRSRSWAAVTMGETPKPPAQPVTSSRRPRSAPAVDVVDAASTYRPLEAVRSEASPVSVVARELVVLLLGTALAVARGRSFSRV